MRIAVSGDAPVDLGQVRRAVRAALRPYRLPRDTQLAIAFVDDAEMRRLNRAHRGKDRTTDVLSFGQELPPGAKGEAARGALRRDVDGGLQLGDLVISVAQARRQAKRGGRALGREVAFLAAHGALHLLGYEDETPDGYREMVRLGTAAVVNAPKGVRTL
ncbi:MAG: rRNA maturation RNase YbeY [Chloroflexota bacterium]|nr:rRNA maturation RNase YbeY [Chloroflexota bacterium]MDE3192879.1 rRNA maturation RNase YbeY [Chloroflexota bacterium]